MEEITKKRKENGESKFIAFEKKKKKGKRVAQQ